MLKPSCRNRRLREWWWCDPAVPTSSGGYFWECTPRNTNCSCRWRKSFGFCTRISSLSFRSAHCIERFGDGCRPKAVQGKEAPDQEVCLKASDLGLGLTDSSVVSPAPVPDSAMATSAASLLQAAISSVLPASTTREVHESSEKGAPTGAEKAAASGRDAMLLLEGPKILP